MLILPSMHALVDAGQGLYWFRVVTANSQQPAASGAGVGVGTAAATLSGAAGTDGNGWGLIAGNYGPFGLCWLLYHGGVIPPVGQAPAVALGDFIDIAWNPVTGNLYLALNGTFMLNSGAPAGSIPTTPTFTGLTGTPLLPMVASYTKFVYNTVLATNPPSGCAFWGGGFSLSDHSQYVTISTVNFTNDTMYNNSPGGGIVVARWNTAR